MGKINNYRYLLDEALSMLTGSTGIDLGSVNTLAWIKGRGVKFFIPSVVAFSRNRKRVVAVGSEAKVMLEKAPPDLQVVKPIQGGAISDFQGATELIKYLLQRIYFHPSFLGPRVVVAIPASLTSVEIKALEEAVAQGGARSIYMIKQNLAAALGCEIPLMDARGSMLVDIGGGVTQIAVISLGGIVMERAHKVAGEKITECIIQYFRENYNLFIGYHTAEDIKINSASLKEREGVLEVKGKQIFSGMPKIIQVREVEIKKAILPVVIEILELIKIALEEIPPELAGDIMEEGMILTGGSSLLEGFEQFIERESKIPVHRVTHPFHSVVLGTAKLLTDKKLFSKMSKEGMLI